MIIEKLKTFPYKNYGVDIRQDFLAKELNNNDRKVGGGVGTTKEIPL